VSIGAKLKARRELLELSQLQLSKMSGIQQSVISRIETEERFNPTLKTLYRLAAALRITVSELTR